jgi:hypothetical protein
MFLTIFTFLSIVFGVFLSQEASDTHISKLDPIPLNFSQHRYEDSYYPYIKKIDYRGFVYE